jgi:hypothetical protein
VRLLQQVVSIKTAKDFELVRKYAPPADTMDCRLVTRAKAAVGDKGLITPCTGGVFNQVAQFRSLEALLTDPLTDEGLYREMMEWTLERVIERDRKLVAAGAEVLEVAGNLATSAVGPRFYTRYVLDYERRLMDAIHEMGALIIFHNCGDRNHASTTIWDRLLGLSAPRWRRRPGRGIARHPSELPCAATSVEFMVRPHLRVKQSARPAVEGQTAGNWICQPPLFL